MGGTSKLNHQKTLKTQTPKALPLDEKIYKNWCISTKYNGKK